MKTRVTTWEIGLLAALSVLYVVLLSVYFVPVVDNIDANGYLISARLFQEHGHFFQVPPDDYAYIGRMWVANSRGEYYPKYPPFYPALMGLVMRGLGVNAGFAVAPACALLAVLGMYVLCRGQFSGPLALIGALALAVNPLLNMFALRQMSHAPSLCLLVWAYAAFFAASRKETGRSSAALGLTAGLLLGCSAGIRYTNVLLAIPPLFLILSEVRGGRSRILAAYLAGLAIPCVLLAVYHWRAFGGPFTTGYALTGEQAGFAWGYIASKIPHYAMPFVTDLTGPALVFSCIGLAVLWRKNRVRAIFFLIWALPVSLLYLSYYWEPSLFPGQFLRFLLPAVVPGILLALVCLNEILLRTAGRRATNVLVILASAGALGWWGIYGSVHLVGEDHVRHSAGKSVIDFITDFVPSGSAVFGHPDLLLALDVKRAYTLYPHVILDKNRLTESVVDIHRPSEYALQDERAGLIEKNLCNLDSGTYSSRIRALLDPALSEGRAIFVVGAKTYVRRSVWSLPGGFTSEPVAEHEHLMLPNTPLAHDKLTVAVRSGAARPQKIAFEIARITRIASPPRPGR